MVREHRPVVDRRGRAGTCRHLDRGRHARAVRALGQTAARRALRHLFDWLVVGQVIPINPAHTVRGPRHVVTSRQTPVLDPAEARALLNSIDVSTQSGLRDRALMVYSFARVGGRVIGAARVRVADIGREEFEEADRGALASGGDQRRQCGQADRREQRRPAGWQRQRWVRLSPLMRLAHEDIEPAPAGTFEAAQNLRVGAFFDGPAVDPKKIAPTSGSGSCSIAVIFAAAARRRGADAREVASSCQLFGCGRSVRWLSFHMAYFVHFLFYQSRLAGATLSSREAGWSAARAHRRARLAG